MQHACSGCRVQQNLVGNRDYCVLESEFLIAVFASRPITIKGTWVVFWGERTTMTEYTLPFVRDWVTQYANTSPDKIATIDLASGRRQTYAEMNERVGRLAGHLKTSGIRPGDRVGFLALNSTDVIDIILAVWRIGGSVLALNYRLTAAELEYIVNDATPKMMIFDHEFASVIDELKPLVSIDQYMRFDGIGGASDLEDAIAGSEPVFDRVEQTIDEQCMLMYSSGTTGRPKGVIITHEMILFSHMSGVAPTKATSDCVWLTIMPQFHIGGLNITSLPAISMGGTAVVMRMFDPEATLDLINDRALGITHTIGVPAMYNAMRFSPKAETTDYSRILSALAGGASVPRELVEWWYKRGLVIQDGYGMTESAASNCMTARHDVPRIVGTSGKPVIFTEMKIANEDGSPVVRGETGEIWMRGPAITPGYWNNEKANRESFVDGWFRSGDIAVQDDEGNYILQDRAKDMYISGGENVYPAEIEGVLYEMEAIQEVAVIGIKDDKWGETGCAVVVTHEGASISIDEIRVHCGSKLARYKHPAHMVLVDILPRNATGKVKKFELRELVPDLLKQND